MKPSDGWCVPICDGHHKDYHTLGGQTFETKHGVDLRHMAASLAARSPYLPSDE